MSEIDAELAGIFHDEATERLDQMDTALVAIESGHAGAETIDSLFRNAHTIKGAAGMLGLTDIRALAHAAEDVLASVRDAGEFPPELAAPLMRATAALRAQVAGAGEPIDDLLDDLAASRAVLTNGAGREQGTSIPEQRPPETSLPEQSPPEQSPPEVSIPETSPPVTSLAETTPSETGAADRSGQAADGRRADAQAPQPAAERRMLRVPATKIDHLLDATGEFIQYRRRLVHSLGEEKGLSEEVADVVAIGERMLDELRDSAVSLRTLPIAMIARPLPRAVRDIARTAGKEVEFAVTGADTELDRVILESLSEPLAHLLRNAVVHGIESPADRLGAGKPSAGRLELRAIPRGSFVEIMVVDDGRGVSPEAMEEARHEGSLADVLAQAGYSTADEVSDLAGRGVGLDAVREYARALGGSLEIRSEPGRGTSVILLLPLALALIEVLLFERGAAVYGVPLAAVEEVLTVPQTLTLQGRPALEVRGRTLPVTDFAVLIGAVAPPLGDRPPALLISAGGHRAIATCDALLGEEQILVKPLGPLLARVEGYLGASILGDGRIALLVEPKMFTRRSGPTPGMTAPAAAGRPDGPETAPKILVVEDSFTVRELQRSILEAAGYPVATARNGRDALRVLQGDARIALVITDLEMPELDGIGLTRAIRADAARSSLPVVIVTSRASEDDKRSGIEAGADAYMSKRSFDQQALLATVERLVGR